MLQRYIRDIRDGSLFRANVSGALSLARPSSVRPICYRHPARIGAPTPGRRGALIPRHDDGAALRCWGRRHEIASVPCRD